MPGVKKYPYLFSPTKIGGLTARNAVKYAACSISNFNTKTGRITRREMARMEVVAKTGAGMITNQGAYPDPPGMGKAYIRQLSLADDEAVEGFAQVAELIHDHGAIAIQQILHGGRYGGIDSDHCLQSSAVPQTLRHFRPPRAMSAEEIEACIDDHVQAARRAVQAGFDGVEVTAFMGYLLANFLSPFTNVRSDGYGGSLENRARFMTELVQAIKAEIGERIFWIRLNGEELMDDRGGSTPEECLEYMRLAEKAGVDGISIVVGWHESTQGALGRDLPTDRWLYLAEKAKEAVGVPLAFGPRFGDAVMADAALGRGKFDFWEVCRPFLADPLTLHKMAEDQVDEIRPCIGGLTCLSRMFRNLPYVCAVNPRLGHEYEAAYAEGSCEEAKTVLVVGGGPAGMECARAAARRGHRVTLLEKNDDLGGQLRVARLEIEAGGRAFDGLVDSYREQLAATGVEVKLGTEVTPKLVRTLAPDVAVVATGAEIGRDQLPGSELPHVVYGEWTTPEQAPAGDRVVVLSAERAGLVLAEQLATAGRRVTIVGEGKVGSDVIPTFKWRHAAWLKELGIEVIAPARVERITEEGVHVDAENGSRVVAADLVVIAGPRRSVDALARDLELVVDELHIIGDAVLPRSLSNAIHEGFRVGNRI
ncbi:MAG: FAD-dependent oxidoreductase [bacterium]|nr:FAD-dependent oxidoreductase [bacterium]